MDRDEFARRVLELEPTLYRICRVQLTDGHDREDAVQETLQKAWERRNQLQDTERMQTWTVRILLNVCHDIQRRQRRVQPAEALPEADWDTTQQELEKRLLRTALLALPEKERLPLLLHYVEGYPVAQAARMLRLPQGTVKSQMRAGRARLRAMLSEEVLTDENG